MKYPVKWFSSAMNGAPNLSLTKGSLIALLDACLIDGFGSAVVTSLTVADGMATGITGAGEAPSRGAVINITGASPSSLNGEHRVLNSSSTTFTFASDTEDTTATGVISVKYSPVGDWEKVYSGSNKAVYRSTDVRSHGHYLRVDENEDAKFARVRGYESMSDVDTGVGEFPTDSQMSGGGYWHKCYTNGAQAIRWYFIGESRFFHLAIAVGSGNNIGYISAHARGFGDPLPLRPGGDPWSTVISVAGSNGNTTQANGVFSRAQSDAGIFVSRAIGGADDGAVAAIVKTYCAGNKAADSGKDALYGAMPNDVDGLMRCSRMYIANGSSLDNAPRADVPGILFIPHSGSGAYIKDGDIIDGGDGLFGRSMLCIGAKAGDVASATVDCRYMIDIAGPWR